MPGKKTPHKSGKAPKLTPGYKLTPKQAEAAQRQAAADMKKHGFKTVDELVDFYDKKRGY